MFNITNTNCRNKKDVNMGLIKYCYAMFLFLRQTDNC